MDAEGSLAMVALSVVLVGSALTSIQRYLSQASTECILYAGIERAVEGEFYRADLNCDRTSEGYIVRNGKLYVERGSVKELLKK